MAASVAGEVMALGLAAAGQLLGFALASFSAGTAKGAGTIGFAEGVTAHAAHPITKTSAKAGRVADIISSQIRLC
jgi:hypothetical protein